MSESKRRWLVMAMAAFVLLGLACVGSGSILISTAPARLDRNPPFWYCATATPLPTATPIPAPEDWCTCTGPNYPVGCGTPAPPDWQCPSWDPPNYPPTPYPTPTPFYMFGPEFYVGQNVFIPIQPNQLQDPSMAGAGYIRLRLEDFAVPPALIKADPTDPTAPCNVASWNVKNLTNSPIDFNLVLQTFVKFQNRPEVWFTRPDVYQRVLQHGIGALDKDGNEYNATRLYPGSDLEYDVLVPICRPGSTNDAVIETLKVGVVLSPYNTPTGTRGMGRNLVAGSDTVIYFNPFKTVPVEPMDSSECHPPYIENVLPPDVPDNIPFLTVPQGGKLSGESPVSEPPCRWVRGFGCSEFFTGVFGGPCPEGWWWHTGIDLSCATGTPVDNVLDGIVMQRGWNTQGYGNLAVTASGPYQSFYAHLSAFGEDPWCPDPEGRCPLRAVIGFVGSTGNSTGPHLHWEIRINGVPTDPLTTAGGQSRDLRLPSARLPKAIVLASAGYAPALAPSATPVMGRKYPMTVLLRDVQGNTVSGPSLTLMRDDETTVGSCAFLDGKCEFALEMGVYRLRLGGSLADGTPVDSVGEANLEAAQSGRAEILHGPLAIWHEGPSTLAGFVLVRSGQHADPYWDAQPQAAVPSPIDPRLDLEPPRLPKAIVPTRTFVARPTVLAAPTRLPSAIGDRAGSSGVLTAFVCLAGLGLVCLSVCLGLWLGRRMRRKGAG